MEMRTVTPKKNHRLCLIVPIYHSEFAVTDESLFQEDDLSSSGLAGNSSRYLFELIPAVSHDRPIKNNGKRASKIALACL